VPFKFSSDVNAAGREFSGSSASSSGSGSGGGGVPRR